MTKEELAELLNGRDFRYALTKDIVEQARASGLVIICGDSDDLMLVRGAITDEFTTLPGRCFMLDAEGVFSFPDQDTPELQKLLQRFMSAKNVLAAWSNDHPNWKICTGCPHARFMLVDEDGNPFSDSVVISKKDLS